MKRLSASIQRAVRDKDRDDKDTPIHGHWLFLARACWLLVTLLAVAYFVVNLPGGFVHLQTLCTSNICTNSYLTPKSVVELKALGLSVGFFATYMTAVIIISAMVWLGVGTIIFWRKSDDRMALFAAFTLVTFGGIVITFMAFPDTLSDRSLAWDLVLRFVYFLGEIGIFLFPYLFPTGQFVPRWTMVLAIIAIVFFGCLIFFPLLPFSRWLNASADLWLDCFLVLGIFAQFYRYIRVSTPLQRQQTKGIVFGLTMAVLGYEGAPFVLQTLHLPQLIFGPLTITLLLLIPLAIGLSILRYRLWNIDVLISRTLVYGTLSVLLGAIYAGCVFGLQFLLSGLTTGNDLAIVASTLAIAALFQPLRGRIQWGIDRRFYRRKYDANRTLAAFSTSLRDEVDLNQLSEQLVMVVQETMQPTHVSLWVRIPEQSRERGTRSLPGSDERVL